jgi:hypothetical protein
MSRFLRPFSKTRDGSIIVRLRVPERQYLRAMAVGLLEHLSTDDPALERLTPTVYADPDLESEYQGFTGTDLDSSRRAAIEEVLKSIDDKKISAQTAELWMRTFNDLRLVLGTQLGVTEEWRDDDMDPEDPRAERYYLYRSLTNVVGALIFAVYEQGNTERGFLFPESDLDGEFEDESDNEFEESDDDDDESDDEYDGYDENAYDFDDLEDDDDEDDYESDQPKDQVDPALIEQLRSIEHLGDLEALSGDGGLDRFDPPSTSPDGGPGGS